MSKRKVLLVIFDGFGEAPSGSGNAITLANTPNLDKLRAKYPLGILQASGEAVGLVPNTMGGSEVGQFTIGAGRIVPQFLSAINNSIKDGSFFQKTQLLNAINHAKKKGKKLHILGMISDEGVHAHIDHLFALLELAKKEGLRDVYIHCITDGRDVEERSVKYYIKQLQNKINELKIGKIATIIGRYYAMDRDKNWDRTMQAYQLMTDGKGTNFKDPFAAIDHFYASDSTLSDYYLPPIVIDKNGLVDSDDALIFFNYRTDRTRQLTSAFVDPNFKEFTQVISKVHFVCMGPYSEIAPIVFDVEKVENNLSQWLGKNKITQLRIAETEKYAHVTFFFNSQIEESFALEDRILVHSPKVPSYAETPEMSAPEIKQKLLQALNDDKHQVIIVNFANPDLVGHSGDLQAVIKAVEFLDQALEEIYLLAMEKQYTMLLTADHGNADDMLYPNGNPKPAHSLNPVIFLVADPENKIKTVKNGGLADIAPTILELLDLSAPKEMTGKVLI